MITRLSRSLLIATEFTKCEYLPRNYRTAINLHDALMITRIYGSNVLCHAQMFCATHQYYHQLEPNRTASHQTTSHLVNPPEINQRPHKPIRKSGGFQGYVSEISLITQEFKRTQVVDLRLLLDFKLGFFITTILDRSCSHSYQPTVINNNF